MEPRAALSSRRQVFATRDAEEARAFVALRGYVLDVPAREATVDMQLDGVYSSGFCLLYLGYGAAAEVRTTRDFDDYRFVAPSRGRLLRGHLRRRGRVSARHRDAGLADAQ